MAEEKPFKPSKRKLQKGRKEGKVLKSQLLSGSIGMLFCLGMASLYWPSDLFKNEMLLEYSFDKGGLAATEYLKTSAWRVFTITAFSLTCASIVSLAAASLISGISFKWEALSPKASRINPAQGIKRLFSNFGFLWQWALRLMLFAGILYLVLNKSFSQLVHVSAWGSSFAVLDFWESSLYGGLGFGSISLIILGIVEYGVNRKKFFKEMSMSHYELKKEHKEDEGDPYQKSARRSLHQELLSQDLVKRVRRSKVVVVETE